MPNPRRRRTTLADPSLDGFHARAGETASQDIAPTDENLRLEAALVERRQHTTNLADWSEASHRLQPGGDIDAPERADVDEEDEDEDDEDDDEDDEDDEDEDEDEDEA